MRKDFVYLCHERNGYRYIFQFPLKNLARKRLIDYDKQRDLCIAAMLLHTVRIFHLYSFDVL